MNGKMSVDELLAQQSSTSCVATVEPVKDEPEMLKITPWVRGQGCLCHLALKIPKDLIEYVTPTGDIHFCCGKSLRVVEIQFREGAVLPVQDIYEQMMQSAQGGQQGGQHGAEAQQPFGPGGHFHHPFEGGGAVGVAPPPFPNAVPFPPPQGFEGAPGMGQVPCGGMPPPQPPFDPYGQATQPQFGAGAGSFAGQAIPFNPQANLQAESGGAEQLSAEPMGDMTAQALPPCPWPYVSMWCGGRYQCVAAGSKCCGGQVVCAGDRKCVYCGGRYHCAAWSENCCGNQILCGNDRLCLNCSGRYHCAAWGQQCCGQQACISGWGCQFCGGRYQCAAPGTYCCNGQVLCPYGYRCVQTIYGWRCTA